MKQVRIDPTDRNRERGAVLVEFAMMLPILAILFLVIIDLGLVIREHQVIENAVREGARYSANPSNLISEVNPGATEEDIRRRVIEYCQGENIAVQEGSITVTQEQTVSFGGQTIALSRVTISYQRRLLVAGAPFLPFGEVTLSADASFRNLY